MGHALNRVLREALDALLEHLDAQNESVQSRIRNLEERVEFIERGYRPRQQPSEVIVVPEKAKAVGAPSERVVMAVKVLLEKVDVGMTLTTLAEHLKATSSSAGRAINVAQKFLPGLIEDGKAGHCRTLCIPKGSEARIRTWLSKQATVASEPTKGVAVLTASENRFILALPSGRIHSATRARDLKYKAKVWGYSVDDQTVTAKKSDRPLARVVPLRG